MIVDDDDGIRKLLADFLAQHGYAAATAASAADMRETLARDPVDLIVLDLMMPGEDGITALRSLQGPDAPLVIMLSAFGTDVDRIAGLEIGAEDFVQKPCNPRELLARIRAVLRRRDRVRAVTEPVSAISAAAVLQRKIFRFAGWSLDATTRVLFDPSDAIVNLSDGEFRMLLAFVERPQRVLTRDQLLDYALGSDKEHFDRAVDVLISRLRRKMAGRVGSLELIRTVRSEGYSFASAVTQ
ncbi:response regulator [Sphingomonas sp. GC_Shp_3]|uniref:response regulator n=1 Tax=Sphingomonas sp. GC_Shp_3 TaxID=2937383 RepID=UPI00226A9A32|nr:response regulator [Sphingomonas sp. GC_Shp_3]